MKLKNIIIAAAIGAFSIGMTGCVRPVEPKILENASPNETMFVVPLVGENKNNQVKFNSEEYFDQQKVAVREYMIPHRWLNKGRFDWTHDGEWIPTVKVIKVDRAPVTIEFDVTDKTEQPIWVESADSVGFSTGFSVSAMIEEANASKFLYRYQSKGLRDVIKTEVRARIQSAAADYCAQYSLDKLRGKKLEMMNHIKEDVLRYFSERGITITTIGQFGGFQYENKDIQLAIDKVFVSQQEKETSAAQLAAVTDINKRTEALARQEGENAKLKAAGEAEAIRLRAEAEAAGNLLKAEADAKGILAVAQATEKAASNPLFLKIRELEVQKDMFNKWNGSVPTTVISEKGVSPNIFLPGTPTSAATVK